MTDATQCAPTKHEFNTKVVETWQTLSTYDTHQVPYILNQRREYVVCTKCGAVVKPFEGRLP